MRRSARAGSRTAGAGGGAQAVRRYTGQQRVAIVRASSDLKTAQYVDVSCATAASSFDDSSEINLVVYR